MRQSSEKGKHNTKQSNNACRVLKWWWTQRSVHLALAYQLTPQVCTTLQLRNGIPGWTAHPLRNAPSERWSINGKQPNNTNQEDLFCFRQVGRFFQQIWPSQNFDKKRSAPWNELWPCPRYTSEPAQQTKCHLHPPEGQLPLLKSRGG